MKTNNAENICNSLEYIAYMYNLDNGKIVWDIISRLSIMSKKGIMNFRKEMIDGLVSAGYCQGLNLEQCASIIFIITEESFLSGLRAGSFCKILCANILRCGPFLDKLKIDTSSTTYSIIGELARIFSSLKDDKDAQFYLCRELVGIRSVNAFYVFMNNFERYRTLVNIVKLDDNTF